MAMDQVELLKLVARSRLDLFPSLAVGRHMDRPVFVGLSLVGLAISAQAFHPCKFSFSEPRTDQLETARRGGKVCVCSGHRCGCGCNYCCDCHCLASLNLSGLDKQVVYLLTRQPYLRRNRFKQGPVPPPIGGVFPLYPGLVTCLPLHPGYCRLNSCKQSGA